MAEATAVFLFFYQALRVLFSALLCVIYDALFAGIVPMSTDGLLLVVVILAQLTPLVASRRSNALGSYRKASCDLPRLEGRRPADDGKVGEVWLRRPAWYHNLTSA